MIGGYDESVGGYVVGLVLPIKEKNKIIGILKVNLNILGSISELLASSNDKDAGEYQLIRSGGEIIYDNKHAPLSKRIHEALSEKIRIGDTNPFLYQDTVNSWIIGMSEIKMTSNSTEDFGFGGSFESLDHKKGNSGESWFILNYRNQNTISKPFQSNVVNILAFGLLLILILAITAFIWGRLTANPLKKLIKHSKKIAKGDFNTQIKLKRKDEIGLLGEAFNHMSKELKQTTTSIKNLEAEINKRHKIEQELTEQNNEFIALNEEYRTINDELIYSKQKVEENELLLNETGRLAKVGGWKIDLKTQKLSWSKEVYKIHEVPEDYEPNVDEAINFYTDQSKDIIQKAVENSINKGKSFDEELEIITAKGNRVLVNSLGRIQYDHDGNPECLFGTFQDITERKKIEQELIKAKEKAEFSEAKYRRLTENAQDMIYRMSLPDGKYEYVSPASINIWEYSPQEFYNSPVLISKTIHPDFHEYFKTEWAELIKGKMSPTYEYKIVTKSGKVKWIHQRNVLIKDDSNNPIAIEGIVTDMTVQRNAELSLKQSEKRLKEINKTKDKFFSIIAHDLKSPFNSIVGFSEHLGEEVKHENYDQIGKISRHILESSNVAMKLLDNLMSWSRFESGGMPFKPEAFDLTITVNEAVHLLSNSAAIKSIEIENKLFDNTLVFADKEMISTVIRNLISNAIKFTNKEGKITISSVVKKNELNILIKDNGVGIPKDRLDDLFILDRNQSTLGTQKEKGTGLGLILCKEFVEKNEGHIWVESEKEKGSTFYFTLPNVAT